MRFFVCLVDSHGAPVAEAVRRHYETLPRSRTLPFEWHRAGAVSLLTAGDAGGEARLVHDSGQVAVGDVRLDNRADIERWAQCAGEKLSDLQLVARLVALHGTRHVPDILGDFAFVVWKPSTRTGVMACDAFAVKRLFYARYGTVLAIASRGEALVAGDERYDVQYLAEVVAFCEPSPGRSPYMGVDALPAATLAVFDESHINRRRYWSAHNFEPQEYQERMERDAAATCRELLATAVKLRLTGRDDTWAQLSGGMDSSSVVCIAQSLEHRGEVRGLAGTVSWVDTHGTGADEREYSGEVARHCGIRNELVIDPPLWGEDELAPPVVDHPSGNYPFYTRDRLMAGNVQRAGGRVLLTGFGGDQLFIGNMFFFADWLAAGRVGPVVREMARRAAIGRVSFWNLAYKNALLPLFPRILRDRLVNGEGQVPPWVTPALVRRYDLFSRSCAPLGYAGRIGHKYSDAVASFIDAASANLTVGVLEDALDVRHPYLYRPLVEFALRLPPELCVRPQERKWILREAMRGILPEPVRTRVGKGITYGLLAWSVANQHARLDPLLRDPILAQLGVVDAAQLHAGFAAAQYERERTQKFVYAGVQVTLAVEAWLRVRSGRWPCAGSVNRHSA